MCRSTRCRSLPSPPPRSRDRKSTRLNSSHLVISYAVFCLKKKKNNTMTLYIHTRNTFLHHPMLPADIVIVLDRLSRAIHQELQLIRPGFAAVRVKLSVLMLLSHL